MSKQRIAFILQTRNLVLSHGVEPRLTDSESVVLPLDEPRIDGAIVDSESGTMKQAGIEPYLPHYVRGVLSVTLHVHYLRLRLLHFRLFVMNTQGRVNTLVDCFQP